MEKSFTLIELLLLVTIIVIIVAAISFTLTNSRKRARDNQGKIDLRAMAEAFELKYNDQGYYPDLPDIAGTKIKDTPNYNNKLDPYLKPPTGNGFRDYFWYDGNDPQKFCLYFQLEINERKYFTCSHKGCQIANTTTCLGF